MVSRKSRLCVQIFSVCFVVFLSVFPIWAQEDPNPDSPTPVLISESESLRALATTPDKLRRGNLAKIKSGAFQPNSKVVLYVTNIDLLANEGASAFRVYVEDAKGRKYRFPVTEI